MVVLFSFNSEILNSDEKNYNLLFQVINLLDFTNMVNVC